MDPSVSQLTLLLRKHKIIGTPTTPITLKENTRTEAINQLQNHQFFNQLRECEEMGISLGYDDVIEYTSDLSLSPTEEEKELGSLLQLTCQNMLHSFFLCQQGSHFYLHLKYTDSLADKIITGPVVTSKKDTPESKRFKDIWGDQVEHRRFEDGKIRVCVSFLPKALHNLPYLLLTRLFRLKTIDGTIKHTTAKRSGRFLNPVFSVEEFDYRYATFNRPSTIESIHRTISRLTESNPIKIQEVSLTGGLSRGTKPAQMERCAVYLKVAPGHRWPVDDPELFSSALTALNGVLGKSLQSKSRVEGLTQHETLYAQLVGEDTEFIFDIEEEKPQNLSKYDLMNFRLAYERFFKAITRKHPIFPKTCVLMKQFLLAHGLYPYYFNDIAVEVLCLRSALHCTTLASGFKAVITTKYNHGYQINIRRGRWKFTPKPTGTLLFTHDAGLFTQALPPVDVFARCNDLFRQTTAIIEASPGLDINLIPTKTFQSIFVPCSAGTAFALSSTPAPDYTEINHYQKSLGGCQNTHNTSSSSQAFTTLRALGAFPYFCGTTKIFVYHHDSTTLPLVIGTAILLTGMQYIRTSLPS
ncbi:hypothetical protein NEHOM01_1026 [Nematocida homosporus]|uniref:uncharacterized protein n=1 Tax=Nematocida homosporus TaxID=1912981 RepID=UPI00221FE54B|nr:uncharacterized protein NEHOM01_1026 [Nematocida homosporus]KAI5185734.1 hypothetical protein NEHOM01_1026 [Nematocida homosporus]